ncbi:DUF370 domain-containing protein [candidate division WWE3 bacterium]|uniref:DUF370 domain-containing protein n=1 Tax=candidate division WWE3 bacterium TaxID=2053526 RepID=A0A3A4ZEQ9_UNCKA|nr:MAG: DUF370 domain-containing protein [candidate division WWE3 bacterium]
MIRIGNDDAIGGDIVTVTSRVNSLPIRALLDVYRAKDRIIDLCGKEKCRTIVILSSGWIIQLSPSIDRVMKTADLAHSANFDAAAKTIEEVPKTNQP